MPARMRSMSFVVLSLLLTIVLLGCAGDRTTRSTGQYAEDSVIAAKVKSALIVDPDVKGTQIDVEVFKGIVQMSGFVDNVTQVRKATTIASNVGGVVEVRHRLCCQFSFHEQQSIMKEIHYESVDKNGPE